MASRSVSLSIHFSEDQSLDKDVPIPLRRWQPGVWERFPILGFGALTLSLSFIIAAAAILVVSDGQEVSTWTI